MIENFIKALIILFGGLIVFVALLPVYNTLIAIIEPLLGTTVTLLLSGAILIIATGLIYNFVAMQGDPQEAR